MEAVPVRRTRSQAKKAEQQQQPASVESKSVDAIAATVDGAATAVVAAAKLPGRRGVPGKKRTPVVRRRPLADVTNDSPIAGMCKTSPAVAAAAAAAAVRKSCATIEEGEENGESLLRSQVQSLLDAKMVEACAMNSFVYSSPCSDHGGPTPANTPAGGGVATTASIDDIYDVDDDQSSNWSVDVNVSSPDKEEEEEEMIAAATANPNEWAMRDPTSKLVDQEEEEQAEVIDQSPDKDEEQDQDDEDEDIDDELCRGVSGISMSDKKPLFSRFAGKHTRYRYNSDDELEEEVIDPPAAVAAAAEEPSPSVIRLNGLPLATGKHLRFQDGQSP